jgi:hypothetical protein
MGPSLGLLRDVSFDVRAPSTVLRPPVSTSVFSLEKASMLALSALGPTECFLLMFVIAAAIIGVFWFERARQSRRKIDECHTVLELLKDRRGGGA